MFKGFFYPEKLSSSVLHGVVVILLLLCCLPLYSKGDEVRSDISYRLRRPADTNGDAIRDLTLISGDSNAVLLIKSSRAFAVFIGPRLWLADRLEARISTDSLKKKYSELPVLRIISGSGSIVKVYLLRQRTPGESAFDLRQRSEKEEFATIGFFLVIAFLLTLLFTNRRTVTGFFSFGQTFSWVSREDPMATVRMTATSNLVYYVILIFQLSLLSTLYQVSSNPSVRFSDLLWRLGSNMLVLILFFLARLIILSGFPGLFGMRVGNGQQFGFIRIITLLGLITCLLMLISFMTGVSASLTFSIVAWLWIIGPAIYFLVVLILMVRLEPSRFLHYFSYLCMSEIIPLLLFSGLLQSQANPDLR